jgi:hypothetical protein
MVKGAGVHGVRGAEGRREKVLWTFSPDRSRLRQRSRERCSVISGYLGHGAALPRWGRLRPRRPGGGGGPCVGARAELLTLGRGACGDGRTLVRAEFASSKIT